MAYRDRYEIYKSDATGEWFWRYWSRNGRILSQSSDGYLKKNNCKNSIRVMKGTAATIVIEGRERV